MGSCISRPQTTEAIVIDMPKKKQPENEEVPKRASAVQSNQANQKSDNVTPNEERNPDAEVNDVKGNQDNQDAEPNQDGQQENNGEAGDNEATDVNDIEFTVSNYPGEGEVEYFNFVPPSDEYILTAVYLHNFYDDEANCDYFNGFKLEWTHPETLETTWHQCVSAEVTNEVFRYEISKLDYIQGLIWSQNESADNFMTHFGFIPKMGAVQEVGIKGDSSKISKQGSQETMLHGLEVGRSTVGRGQFVWIKPIWTPLPESKYLDAKSSNRSFLSDTKNLNTELLNKQMVYSYKKPSEVFNEFQALIDPKNPAEEYLGGLATRFLSPQDQVRLDNMLKECKGTGVIKQLKEKTKFNKQNLSSDLKKEIVNICTALITKELRAGQGLNSISENIRFLNKIFAALYNDDHELWNAVKANVGTSCSEFNTIIFKEAIDQMVADPNMKSIQEEPDYQDPAFKGVNQKGCPQKVDEGQFTDVPDIINQYIHEAKQIIMEFHATMRNLFGSHYIGAPVKGFNRIKAKVDEYIEEEKLGASDAVAKVMDFVRGTVVSYNGDELKQSLVTLRNHKAFKIVRLKNGFKDLKKEAFKSILINVMAYNCMICEVQLTLKPMKTFNEISHFIYEIQREESLYNMVANHLNINQQFKSWVEPFVPNERKLPLPESHIRWKGYIHGDQPGQNFNINQGFFGSNFDALGFVVQSGTGAYLDIHLLFTKDGKIYGYQNEPRANAVYNIEGTHQDYKTVDFTLNGKVTNHFQGKFVDTSVIEGNMAGNGAKFRIYIGDMNYPTLSAVAVDTDFHKVRKQNIPEAAVAWSGFSYDIANPRTKVPMNFTLRMSDTLAIGHGTLGQDQIAIMGKHEDYRTMSFEAQMLGSARFYDGVFINNYTVKGKYNQQGELGNFELYVVDPNILSALNPVPSSMDQWEGYYETSTGTKGDLNLHLEITENGKIRGQGQDSNGHFNIEGTHENRKKMEWVKTMIVQNGWTIKYFGDFTSENCIEGRYLVGGNTGTFKLSKVENQE